MAESSGQEQSEKPTPRRIQKAREKGDFAHTREWPSTLALFGGLFVLLGTKFKILDTWENLLRSLFSSLPSFIFQEDKFGTLVPLVLGSLTRILVPLFIATVLAALAGGWSQSGLIFSWESLHPQFSRLNFISGIKNLFSKRLVEESLKTIVKLFGLGLIAGFFLKKIIDQKFLFIGMESGPLFWAICQIVFKFFVWAALFMVIYSGIDYFFQRRQWMKKMMMTKQEVKEEMKESEGNPQVKSKIRSIMKKMAGNRMMNRIGDAKVVVTNPTHLAIALEYKKNMKAPRVLAKGSGFLAQKIKQKAIEHQITIVENKPLARLLYRWVDVGEDIPASLYQAVAEVLAYVHWLSQKSLRANHAN